MLENLYIEINRVRQIHGFMPCSPNNYLEIAASKHAEDMQINNYVSHVGLNGSSYISRVRDTGAKFNPTGEIICKGPGGKNCISAVVDAWLKSPGHREIMLHPMNVFYGGGYRLKSDEYKGNYWVVLFANHIN